MNDSHVQEDDLDFLRFHCCGDEDLYPFQCSACRRLMVFCYECDTLYPDLHTLAPGGDVNALDDSRPIFHCPQCGHGFEYFFMDNPIYRASFEQWRSGGFAHLLRGVMRTPPNK